MGAISDTSSIEVLKEFLNDSARCVRETCEIAISKVQWDNSEEGKEHHERLDNELRYASTLPVLLDFYFYYQLVIFFQEIHFSRPRACIFRTAAGPSKSRKLIRRID